MFGRIVNIGWTIPGDQGVDIISALQSGASIMDVRPPYLTYDARKADRNDDSQEQYDSLEATENAT
jgi:hypothetical protein